MDFMQHGSLKHLWKVVAKGLLRYEPKCIGVDENQLQYSLAVRKTKILIPV
jgi:hypothetical protein